jgi:hypothetical protein
VLLLFAALNGGRLERCGVTGQDTAATAILPPTGW